MQGKKIWWYSDLKAVNTIYIKSLRDLLGVRTVICTDLIYLESGEPIVSAWMGKYIHQLKQLQQDPITDERENLRIKVKNHT